MIVIYGTPTCTKCKQVLLLLSARDVDFTYLTVGQDVEKADVEEAAGRPVSSVPVILQDGIELSMGALMAAV